MSFPGDDSDTLVVQKLDRLDDRLENIQTAQEKVLNRQQQFEESQDEILNTLKRVAMEQTTPSGGGAEGARTDSDIDGGENGNGVMGGTGGSGNTGNDAGDALENIAGTLDELNETLKDIKDEL